MVVGVRIDIQAGQLMKVLNKLPTELPKQVNNVVFDYAKLLAIKLQQAATTDPKRPITPNRLRAAGKIAARKVNKTQTNIVMPTSLILLDSMSPHYVALKPGRAITRWARSNFNGHKITGRSRAMRGPRGGILPFFYDVQGIKRSSALFVTPHRFVNPTLHKERNKLPNHLRRGINKAFKSSAI